VDPCQLVASVHSKSACPKLHSRLLRLTMLEAPEKITPLPQFKSLNKDNVPPLRLIAPDIGNTSSNTQVVVASSNVKPFLNHAKPSMVLSMSIAGKVIVGCTETTVFDPTITACTGHE